jgi:U3 small nucleolar RNA-associated protein 3
MPPKGGARGRRGGKGASSEGVQRRSTRSRGPVGLDPDLEEDVDKFMDGRNKIMLGDEKAGADSDEDEDDVDVVGLGGDSDDSDEDSDDSAGVRKAALSDDDDDEGGKGEDESGYWGKKKGDYYDADEAENSEDEREEEKEARKLQQKRSAGLRAEDFGDDEIASSDDDSAEQEPSLGEAVADGKEHAPKKGKGAERTPVSRDQKTKKKAKGSAGTTEGRMLQELDDALGALDGDGALRVERDLSGMSEREKMKLLKHDAPELTSLLSDFKSYMKMLRTQLLPAREAALKGAAPPEGLSYLDTKIQLTTRYCSSVAFYLLLRTEGMSVKTHPVIDNLVELRRLLGPSSCCLL